MALIIDGRKLAREKEKALAQKSTRPLKLVSFLVGENEASMRFLALKQRAAQRVGIGFELIKLPDLGGLADLIRQKNVDASVQGILVQLPLPGSLEVLDLIAPSKDVDCLGKENLSLLAVGKPRFLPAVVEAIMEIVDFAKYPLAGTKTAVVGQGRLVGLPLSQHLRNLEAQVLVADEYTQDLPALTKQADILVTASGVPNLIKREMVKPGALVIDVGSPQPEVDFEEVKKVAGAITPVPGGVGPLTVVSLLENVFTAANYAIIKHH
jgi:methylenetetrahydrofolate dehydrogenase (NADP+)/methenyltetrahydrofolate cyclohydrolase